MEVAAEEIAVEGVGTVAMTVEVVAEVADIIMEVVVEVVDMIVEAEEADLIVEVEKEAPLEAAAVVEAASTLVDPLLALLSLSRRFSHTIVFSAKIISDQQVLSFLQISQLPMRKMPKSLKARPSICRSSRSLKFLSRFDLDTPILGRKSCYELTISQ